MAQARGSEVSFLPGLAFAVILATNLMVVLGSVVTAPRATAEETASQSAEAMQVSDGDAAPPESAPPGRRSRRWILDAVMLVLLTISGIVLWYSNQSPEFRSKGLEHWVRVHVQRQR